MSRYEWIPYLHLYMSQHHLDKQLRAYAFPVCKSFKSGYYVSYYNAYRTDMLPQLLDEPPSHISRSSNKIARRKTDTFLAIFLPVTLSPAACR